MTNNLIENKTKVFYTVQASDNTVVSESYFSGGDLRNVQVSRESTKAHKYDLKSTATKIAEFVEGKLIKHTRTEIITEVTEEIKIEGEK